MKAPVPTSCGAAALTRSTIWQGKRIAFARDSVGEYFVYYALSIAQLSPRSQVTLVPQDSVEDAIDVFNNGQADVVSAWEPNIYDAEQSGGVSCSAPSSCASSLT
jgi:ABC-type nitrate/sulfonate/bicarbonate transport system substrate-binding protein